MGALTEWQTLLFLLPLLAAVVLVAGLAFGLGDGGDGDGDADADADADSAHADHADHGEHGALAGARALLGIGRVPITVVLMSLFLFFGTAGLASNVLLRDVLPSAYGFVSLLVAAFASVSLTALVSRAMARFLPTRESSNVHKDDLVGAIGHAVVEITGDDGFLQVRDHEGNLHQVRGRSSGEALAKGTRVVLVDRRRDGDYYLVEPLALDEPAAPGGAVPARVKLH